MSNRRKRQRLPVQFNRSDHGGARDRAGRPRKHTRGRVAHRTRQRFSSARPLHVTIRVVQQMRSLRKRKKYKVLYDVFCKTRRPGFRICQYSVQDDHIHLIVEATNRATMTAGMRSVNIRIGKGINRAFGRKSGKVIGQRYHEEHLGSPRQVRNTLAYVLNNYIANNSRRHGGKDIGAAGGPDSFDPCSSAEYFSGWKGAKDPVPITPDAPVSAPRTLLLRKLWRRHQLIELNAVPGAG